MSVTKTAVSQSYTPGESIAYAVSIVNSGAAAVTGLTVTDDLGGFEFEGETVYPLEYVDGSLLYLVNGVPQAAPAVTAGPPASVTGLEIPAGGNAVLIYEARVTRFAPLGEDAAIVNTVTVEGGCEPLTATATVTMAEEAELTLSKAVSPETVDGCGELTYTFAIRNAGGAEADAADAVVVTDTFDPILNGIEVTLNGTALAADTGYTYDETTGAFATVAGQIAVPAATYTQNEDGSWTAAPGVTVLTVTGTL